MTFLNQLSNLKAGELNWLQAQKFAKRFGLTNLRIEKGEWWADDDGQPYRISQENYSGAVSDGDIQLS